MTAAGLLLLLQSVGLAVLAGRQYPVDLPLQAQSTDVFFNLVSELLPSNTFGWLALIDFVTVFFFLRLSQRAWSAAMFVQGGSLVAGLILYFRSKPLYIYPLMIYAIFMVIYLHYNVVRGAFQPAPETQEAGAST